MKFKDVLWKNTLGEIVLYHTRSAYKVVVDKDTLNVLWGMCGKNPDELNEREKDYYQKLSAQKIMETGLGTIPEERSQTPLVHLDLEIASVCNLQCKHCFANNSGGVMDMKIFRAIMNEALKLGVIAVSLNGGEPLLHPRIVEIIRTARQSFRADLFTNVTLVTKQFCEEVAPLGLDKVFVSLDGFREKHEAVRGEGTFERTLQGIRLLREYGIRVWINSILHQDNEDDLPQFKKFCLEDLKVNGIGFVPVHPIGNARQNRQMFKYPQKTRNSLSPLPDKMEDHVLRRSDFLRCRAGVGTLHITSRGEVFPCSYFQRSAVCLGNMVDKPLEEIYKNHLQQDTIFTRFHEDKLTECRNCQFFSTCLGGCRGRAFLFTKNLYSKDPVACATRGLIPDIPED